MLGFLFSFSYFFLIPLFFFEKEFIWSKVYLFSILNVFWFIIFVWKKRINLTKYLFIAVAYICVCLLSLAYAYDIYRSLYLLIIYFNVLCFLFLLHLNEPDEKWATYAILGSILIVSIVGFLQYAGVLKVFYTKYGERDIPGTFGLSNFAGEFLAVASLFLYVSFENERKWPVGVIGIFTAFLYIVLAEARAAFVGLVGGGFAGLLLLTFKKKINPYWVLGVILIAFIALWSPYGKGMLRRLKKGFALKDSPVAYRIECWKAAIKMFEDHPIGGVGLGNFEVYVRKYASERLEGLADALTVKIKRPHNEYIQVLGETGLIGFGIFVFFLFYPLYHAFKKKVHLLAPQISFLLIAIFSFPFQNISAFSIYVFTSYISLPNEKMNKPLPTFVYTSISAILVFTMVCSMLIFLGEVNRRKAIVAYNKKQYHRSLLYIDRAIKFNPLESDHYFSRGQSYYKLKRYDRAIQDFRRYLKKNPYHGRAYLIVAMLEYDMGKLDDAKRHIEFAMRYSKKKPPLLYLSAFLIYRDSGNREKAYQVLKEGLFKYPDLLKILNNKKGFRVPNNP